jgi:hypothetical protein
MRSRSPLLLFALFCLVAALSFALPDKVEEREGTGIEIVTDPENADVFIDGIRKGKTPLDLSDLKSGAHSLEIQKEGYRPRQEMILVKETGKLSIYLELRSTTGKASVTVRPARGRAELASAPFEAEVTIDGVRKSVGVIELTAGLHTVKASAFGWVDQIRSVRVETDAFIILDMELAPAEFRVSQLGASRRRFNPMDGGKLGSTAIGFLVSAPGSGQVTITSKSGAVVFSDELAPFTTWKQEFEWNGRDAAGEPLADGEYTVVIRAVSVPLAGKQASIEVDRLTVSLDSSVAVRAASVAAGIAGTLYAPQARLLPSGSFQIEGSLLFGDSYDGAIGDAPPFALGLRFAPADRWEAAAAVNIIGASSEDSTTSVALSVRRAILSASGRSPFSAALALRYGWLSEGESTPFATPSGIEVDLPLELGEPSDRGFFLGVSPGLRWSGNTLGASTPLAVFAAAAGRRSSGYVAALSAKTEREFSGGDGPLFIGAEARFFPPPSTLVYGLSAGARFQDGDRGFSGGLSFGILF